VSLGVLLVALVALAQLAFAGASAASQEKTWNPTQVITALRHASLPIGRVQSYTASSDPNKLLGRPSQYTGKANFKDRRLKAAGFDVDNGGSVETFANRDDAKRRFDYVRAIAKSPLFAEYDYLEGTVLLRISSDLTPTQAKAYEQALRKAV